MPKIRINKQFLSTFNLIETTNQHVFITGKAGTGKSTFLKYLTSKTKKNFVLLAPTGVAAVNIGGQTIHSFFNFGINTLPTDIKDKSFPIRLHKIIKQLDLIIIDEISMVRAELLDNIDLTLKKLTRNKAPFGGKQMLFIGDLFQLPPVVQKNEEQILKQLGYRSFYFFDSFIFNNPTFSLQIIEFNKIFRQQDKQFIEILNRLRIGKPTLKDIAILNKRYKAKKQKGAMYIYLATTNSIVDKINQIALSKINKPPCIFNAEITGNFNLNAAPTKQTLVIKPGAQVMLLNNDQANRWVNGTLGKIISCSKHDKKVKILLENGKEVDVTPFTWEQNKYEYDPNTKHIQSTVIGTFTQLPLKLAWAITIHKSQGKTFSHIILDIGHGTFSPGQLYVGLSRATSLKGIILARPISIKHVWTNSRVEEFIRRWRKGEI